jgi:hypothetical protein
VLGLLATLAYLAPGLPRTVVELAAASAVLGGPFVLFRGRRNEVRIVAAWLVGGLLGAYFFGVGVAVTGIVGGVVLGCRSVMRRRHSR